MSVSVTIIDADLIIPHDNLDKALSIWKSMNVHPAYELKKNGGSSTQRWFSGLAPDYHLNVHSVQEMLGKLGFLTRTTDEGVEILSFYDEQGQESLFLRAIEPLIAPHSFIKWFAHGYNESWIENYN